MTWIYAPARPEGDGTHGIAILSRYPLANVMVRELPFIDEHNKPRRRIALAADLDVGGTIVRICNVHLDVRLGPVDRIRQLSPAVVDLPSPAIVGGDFNSNPWAWIDSLPVTPPATVTGADQAAVLDDYMDEQAFGRALPDGVGTMRIPVLNIRIDQLYARELAIGAADVEHVDGSDHWPVYFDVTL
jgi:endonuclease/exonuclease/phosphatase family metal-dependent hydrolase